MKKEAMLYEKLENNKVKCNLCSHNCIILDSNYGLCNVRQNIGGKLYSNVYGNIIASNIDPIEKKPLYHFLPGTKSYSIATLGCNFKCSFCQNWRISQKKEKQTEFLNNYIEPKDIIRNALENNCKSISYTYTEPTIFFEYAYDAAKIAKENSLKNIFVTNGYMTEKAINKISSYLDAANVDLKSFSEEFYNKMCKAKLKPVLNSIKKLKDNGVWVEITTLIVPGQNDSDQELHKTAEYISTVGTEIPWHISRFHPDYNYKDSYKTPIKTMKKAYNIAKEHNLKYVYLGNVIEEKDTICSNCGNILINRSAFGLVKNNIINNKCPKCNEKADGLF